MNPLRSVLFADLALARRLENAEGLACVQFAAAWRSVDPESGADWMRHAGTYVVFDGVSSPVTQTFGLGIFEELSGEALDEMERFFRLRGAPVHHEVCPLAGLETINLLCERRYRPIEISSVLYRLVEGPGVGDSPDLKVRVVEAPEAELWSEVQARGWTYEHPELSDFVRLFGSIGALREGNISLLASVQG